MGNTVQYGIRINVDGDRASTVAIDGVRKSTSDLGTTAQAAGRNAATGIQQVVRETEVAQAKLAVSAKQTAAALRGVPAQFTDIFTSLQGGQAPLTVFLQQGGQLKDMFGGAGAAARAMGGYVLGMVNPLTLGAAALIATAVAYNQGSKEADAYNQSIIMSGNVAGTTAGQLTDMARNISATIGTQGEAAAAVAAMTGTGQVAASNLEYFSTVAVKAQRNLGIGAADMAKEFASLGDAPLKASERLTEKYRYLTSAVYEQIKAAEEQGRIEDAAAIAQKAFADAFDSRADQVEKSLGSIERAWRGVTDWAKSGWDAMLDIGRSETKTEELDRVSQIIANKQSALAGRRARTGVQDDSITKAGEAEIAALKVRQGLLQAGTLEQNRANEAAASSRRLSEANIAWSKEGDKYLTRGAQLQRDLAKARNEGAAAGKSQAEIEVRIAAIRDKYADKGAAQKAASALRTEAAALAEVAGLTSSFATEWDLLNGLFAKGKITTEQLTEAQAKLLAKQPAMKEAAESTAAAEKWMVKFRTDYIKATEMMLEPMKKAVSAAVEEADKNEQLARTFGMTAGAIERMELARLEEQLAQRASLGLTLDEIEYLEKLIAAKSRSAAALSSIDDKKEATKANDEKIDEWKKTVDKHKDIFRQGFADMLNNGKDGWRSFTKSLVTTFKTSVVDQIYKSFAQPFVVRMVADLIGVTGGSTISTAANAASGGGGIAGMVSAAKGVYTALSTGFESIGTVVADSVQAAMYGSGASPTLLTNGSFATGAGTAATYMAGAAVGVYGGRAISNGYAAGGGSGNSAVNIGTAIGAVIAGPIGAAIGGMLGGTVNRLFGHKPKEVTSTTINGSFGNDGFSGTTDSAWIKKGGTFRSDKKGFDKPEVDAATAKQFSSGYDAIKLASADFAQVLGINADVIKTRAQSLSIAITKDGEANKKAIADFFVGVGDSIAKELLPTISVFAKEGEGASATLQRLATNYAATDAALNALGLRFGAVGVQSIAARERLISLSGGIEALVQNAAGFAQNYLTEAERLAPVAAMVAKAMSDLGFSSVDTRDEFKALIQSLDLTTESGAANYAALMKLQGAFAQVHPVVEAATAAVVDHAAALEDARASAKTAAAALLSGVDDAYSVLQRVAQGSIDILSARIAEGKALSSAIRSTLGSMVAQGSEMLNRARAQAQIRSALATAASGGKLPNAEEMSKALAAISQDSANMFGTYADYARDFYTTQNDIAALGDLADAALSVDEKALNAIQEMLNATRDQIDELKGVNVNGLTLIQAVEGVRAAIAAAQANPLVSSAASINDAYKTSLGRAPDAAGMQYFQDKVAQGAPISEVIGAIKNSPEAKVQELYQSVFGRTGDGGGVAYWTKALSNGMSVEAARELMMQSSEYQNPNKIPAFEHGGNHFGGVRLVGEVGPEFEVTGASRIHSTNDIMESLRNPSSGNAVLVAEVRALRVELAGVKREVSRGADGAVLAGSSLENAAAGGPIRVRVVNTVMTEQG